MSSEIEYRSEIVKEYPGIVLVGEGKTPPSADEWDLRRTNSFFETVMTTDFSVTGDHKEPVRSSNGTLLGYRYQYSGVLNIDHHFDEPEMWRNVSSANLAIEYVKDNPFQSSVSPVHITHTDTDSILAAGILAKYLEPEERFGVAAVASDHTGEENAIGDLLMAVEPLRDVTLSMHVLGKLLRGEQLPELAQALLEKRLDQREEARNVVESGAFVDLGQGVRLAQIEDPIPGELFPSLMPDASIILLVSPIKEKPGFSEIKTRTGLAFPEGKSLHALSLPGWGGRWDAGSTKRHGGTEDTEAFIKHLLDHLPAVLQAA